MSKTKNIERILILHIRTLPDSENVLLNKVFNVFEQLLETNYCIQKYINAINKIISKEIGFVVYIEIKRGENLIFL